MLGRIIRERVSSNCLPSPNLAPWAAAELLAALSAAGSKRSMHTTTMESLSLHARGFQAPARASVRSPARMSYMISAAGAAPAWRSSATLRSARAVARPSPRNAGIAAAAASGDASAAKDSGDMNERDKALQSVLRDLNKKFGANSVVFLGAKEAADVERTPSGSLTLDLALGGGYPVGRIVEIFGPESSGKTTLAVHAIAEVQRRGGRAAFIDAEHSLDATYAASLGVDLDSLLVHQPEAGEDALEVADTLMRSRAVDMIVVDSVSALVPRSELEGQVGALQVGGQARLMSGAMRKLAQSASRSRCTLVFLNQLRHKVGVLYGNPETTSGGQALKYYASVRIDVRAKGQLVEGSEAIGMRVLAKVKKNKTAPPFREAGFDLLFKQGIDSVGCVIDAAENLGVMVRRGAFYYYGSRNLAQGRAKTIEVLKGDAGLRGQVEEEVRAKMRGVVSAVNANLGASSEAVAEDALVGLAEDMERGRGEYEEWGEDPDNVAEEKSGFAP